MSKGESSSDGLRHRTGIFPVGVAALTLLLARQAPCAQQSLPASLEGLFAKGVQAQKAGRLDEAENAFLQVLGRGGRVAFVHNNLGIVYQLRGEHPRAIAQFREAIRLQPSYAAPRILAGASLLALGKTAEATQQLERAVRLQPREPLARLELAKAYERADNLPGAVDQLRAVVELSPQEPENAYQLGNAYLKLEAWCYSEIRRFKPRSARLHQVLAENYRAQGRQELAIRALQRAAQLEPGLAEIHLALAQAYLDQGKSAEAQKEIEQELAIVPESAAALTLRQKIEAARRPPH